MSKRIKLIFFIICTIISITTIHIIFTTAKSNKTTYVALGDSIAAGYGLKGYLANQELPPDDSYQTIVANFLKTSPFNYAVSGDNSNDCINLLNLGTADTALKNADIITISIGSNDLLQPFVELVKENGLTFKLKDYEILNQKIEEFYVNFDKIIKILKHKAPKAEIYVTNIYNPFNDVIILGEFADSYIRKINKIFNVDSDIYTVIDLYTLFKNNKLSNVEFHISDIKNINLDPHPSKKGHKEIAAAIIDALNKNHAPDTPKITNAKSTAKNKISVKFSCSAKKSGYEIKFSTSKNGKYRLLATVSKDKANIKSSKLKTGQKYYIQARCYNNINGVKYYSAYSKPSKIEVK